METISVIIPVFRVEEYLSRCVVSVVNQTYKDLEIILVDDGSDDRCPEICDSWARKDARIKVIHKKNGGLSSARNAGLEAATGLYVAFVDSDDWIEPQMYEKLYQMLELYPDCQIAECGYRKAIELSEGIENLSFDNYKILDNNDIMNMFYRVGGKYFNPVVWNKLIKRELFIDFKFIDTLNEDWEATFEWYRKTSRLIYLDVPMYNYFYNAEGTINSKFKKKRLDFLIVCDRLLVKTKKYYPQYEWYAEFMKKRAYFTLLSHYIFNGPEIDNTEYRNIYKMLRKNTMNNFITLMKHLRPNSRRILLLLVVLSPDLAAYVGNFWRKTCRV